MKTNKQHKFKNPGYDRLFLSIPFVLMNLILSPLWPEASTVWSLPEKGQTHLTAPAQKWFTAYPLTPPRLYQGDRLEYIMMPIGGIGTGTIWLDGQGRLAIWQIFNNYDESRVPNSLFAVRVKSTGAEPVTRVLQTVAEGPLQPMSSLTYEGGYPLARLTFADSALPITVQMEAFNPMIPLDTLNSAIPCALFRLTAKNTGKTPTEVAFFGTLNNSRGDHNHVVKHQEMTAVMMDKGTEPSFSGPVKICGSAKTEATDQELYWLSQTPGLIPSVVSPMSKTAMKGGILIAAAVRPEFLKGLIAQRATQGQLEKEGFVFEDFEKDSYGDWKISGDAFGKGPAHGTLDSQQDVSGFSGSGLVNTYLGGDGPQGMAVSKPFQIEKKYVGFLIGGGYHPNILAFNDREKIAEIFEDFERDNYEGWQITGEAFGKAPAHGKISWQIEVTGFSGKGLMNSFNGSDTPQGTATSKTFRIQRKYICFLIGGGNRPGETCMNLLVDGKVVRTAIGKNNEVLDVVTWDVSELKGKEARLEIVDKSSGGWGHILVDQIAFSDVPLEETCVNLRVDNKIIRTATGQNSEALEPCIWDVSDLKGKEAIIEIVDHNSGGWGHINIDQIIFSDVSPQNMLREGTDVDTITKALDFSFTGIEATTFTEGQKVVLTEDGLPLLKSAKGDWPIAQYTRLKDFAAGDKSFRILARTSTGDPLLIEGPLNKGRVILAMAPNLPWSWGTDLMAAFLKEPLKEGQKLAPGVPEWGSMALSVAGTQAIALSSWSTNEELLGFMEDPSKKGSRDATETTRQAGKPFNGALGVPFSLKPAEARTITFAITWSFPNIQRFQHTGNLYSHFWSDALAVADYVADHRTYLWERTRLYHDTVYQSNLPEEFLDAFTSQSVIFRGPTCFWSEDGYFGGYEGSYGCCPLNCTHVWNYAQSHARLFPDVGQNMRVSDFLAYLHENGETSHRQSGPHVAFIDGHCACIEGAYREFQLSPDMTFLEKIWPGVKKAVDWMIEFYDKDRDGVPAGLQPNTYDCNVSGANTFIGSQYLSALKAGEQMALAMKDTECIKRWREVREAGIKNQNEKLWNGEYYFQIPEKPGASDYNNGCHADQLLGQWWAHMLNLGYLYPQDRVRSALQAVMKYNFRDNFVGFTQSPRRYIPDDEGGLLMCTWPKKDRPNPFTLYSDEVWTGIEYAVAGAMVYEGLLDQARIIVKMARSRYDGRKRDDLNSGPGGNPFNDLECGKFYARAMSSGGLLIASQGLVLEGPRGRLGFKPKWQPEDHRSFFTAPEGWGLFAQTRKSKIQTERIEVRHGRLRLKELVFEVPGGSSVKEVSVSLDHQTLKTQRQKEGEEIRLAFAKDVIVSEGRSIEVRFIFQ